MIIIVRLPERRLIKWFWPAPVLLFYFYNHLDVLGITAINNWIGRKSNRTIHSNEQQYTQLQKCKKVSIYNLRSSFLEFFRSFYSENKIILKSSKIGGYSH